MLHLYPYVPLGWQVRIGVALISYVGTLHFGFTDDHGFTGDYDSTADLDVLRGGVEAGLTELIEALP